VPGLRPRRGRPWLASTRAAVLAFRRDNGVGNPKRCFTAQWLGLCVTCRRLASRPRGDDARRGPMRLASLHRSWTFTTTLAGLRRTVPDYRWEDRAIGRLL